MSENSHAYYTKNAERGGLKLEVYTGSRAFPVSGAHIIISRETQNGEELLKTLFTNSSGSTEVVYLSAPPAQNSKKAGGGKAYSVYNIRVDKSGYYTVEDLDVPIFSGIVAIQPVALVPLPFGTESGKNKFFVESEPKDLEGSGE